MKLIIAILTKIRYKKIVSPLLKSLDVNFETELKKAHSQLNKMLRKQLIFIVGLMTLAIALVIYRFIYLKNATSIEFLMTRFWEGHATVEIIIAIAFLIVFIVSTIAFAQLSLETPLDVLDDSQIELINQYLKTNNLRITRKLKNVYEMRHIVPTT